MPARKLKQYFAARQTEALARRIPALKAYSDAMGWQAEGEVLDSEAALKSLRKAEIALEQDKQAVILPNPDRAAFFQNPFVVAEIGAGDDPASDLTPQQFMAAAAFPGGWNVRLFAATMVCAAGADAKQDALGFGALVFPQDGEQSAAGKSGDLRINFIFDAAGGKAAIVGAELSLAQRRALRLAGVSYADAREFGPDALIRGLQNRSHFLKDVFNGVSTQRHNALQDALAARHLLHEKLVGDQLIMPENSSPTARSVYRLK